MKKKNDQESFSYSVAHDLRAPLRAIQGFSRILLEDHAEGLSKEAILLLNKICKNTEMMSQLIDDLLAFSKIGRKAMAKHRVPMRDLVDVVVNQLRELEASRPVKISIRAIPDSTGDAPLLRQVWTNLISNALKFTRTRTTPKIEIGAHQASGEMTYFVRDNGVGFDMRYADKLFHVFQRLHSVQEFEGTGVGLAIVQRIIQRHGGRVWAKGKPGRGATIYFALPR